MHMHTTRELVLPPVVESWYFVCRSRDLRRGQTRAWSLPGLPLVVYRGASGRVHALAGHCAHLGAHLAHGEVIDDRLRCPLHHWTYDGDGRCEVPAACRPTAAAPPLSAAAATPAATASSPVATTPFGRHLAVPGPARTGAPAATAAFPVVERDGGVFVFAGRTPAFALPSWLDDERRDADADAKADAFCVSIGAAVDIDTSWHACALNGFDVLHFETVHQRALREPAVVRTIGEHAMELRYVSRVLGHSAADRAMRWIAGDCVRVTIACWGGPMFVVRSEAGPFVNHLMLCLTPTETALKVTPLVAVPRTRVPGPDRLRAAVTRWLFLSFLGRDLAPLSGMRLRAEAALEHEGPLATFVRWLAMRPPIVVAASTSASISATAPAPASTRAVARAAR